MKKTLFIFAILFICFIIISPKTAHADSSGDYYYYDNGDGTCTIYSYYGSDRTLTIPETLGGLTVTHIDDEAFYQNIFLNNLTLPDSLIFVGNEAFLTYYLYSVDLGDSVKYIGSEAFRGELFQRITSLPDSLTYIGDSAFEYNFELPEGTGEWYQFNGSSSNKTGNVYSGGDTVTYYYGYALNDYNYERNTDYLYTITQYTGDDTTINLPATLEGKYISYIQEDAFASEDLTSVSFSWPIKYIGTGAFANNRISSITLADSLLQIGLGAFADNNTEVFTLSSGDWLVFDENGYTGETASGGDKVSVNFGYTQIDNNKPWRKSSASVTSSETILITDTYSVNLSNIFNDNYYDTLTYQVSIDGADYIDADESFSFAPSTAKDYTLVFRAFDD